MAEEQHNKDAVEPGMIIETTKGDLGDGDISKPKVSEVIRDEQGHVEEIVVRKGIFFKKELEVPADRIQVVEEGTLQYPEGDAILDMNRKEIEGLSAVGAEELLHEREFREQDSDNFLGEIEEAIPTAEGLRSMEQEREQLGQAVASTFGWPAGLSKKPWQSEGFYLILTFALLVSLVLALIHIDPITLLFWANVFSGFLSPLLVFFLFLVGNNRKVMGNHRLSLLVNVGLVVTIFVMTAAVILLFYGLITRQS